MYFSIIQIDDADIDRAIEENYPNFFDLTIARFTLASVVYHLEFLKKTLPATHPLFSAPLFRNPHLLQSLISKLQYRLAVPTDPIQPTGIPPHTFIINQLASIADGWMEKAIEILKTIEFARANTVKDIVQVLEENAVGFNTVTRNGLEETIKKVMLDAGLKELLDSVRNPAPSQPSSSSSSSSGPTDASMTPTLHPWKNGSLRRVPEDFQFPKVSSS